MAYMAKKNQRRKRFKKANITYYNCNNIYNIYQTSIPDNFIEKRFGKGIDEVKCVLNLLWKLFHSVLVMIGMKTPK